MNISDIVSNKKNQEVFDIVIEEACRQWCDFVDEAPERRTGEGFANFFFEIFEDKGQEYREQIDVIYAEKSRDCLDADKFIKTENGFSEFYYNYDATAGGQVVRLDFDADVIKEAVRVSKNKEDFFSYISSASKEYLTDAGDLSFRDAFDNFKNLKADFEGATKKTMQGLMKAVGIKPPNKDMER